MKQGSATARAALIIGSICATVFVANKLVEAQSVNFSQASQAYVDNAVTNMQTTIMGVIPQAATVIPNSDTGAGAIGTSGSYMRQDSIRPARYRSSNCTLSGGACTMNWSSTFATVPNPVGNPSLVNPAPSTLSIVCNWTAITTASGTVSCKSQSLSVTISLGLLNLLVNSSDGIVVAGTVIPPL